MRTLVAVLLLCVGVLPVLAGVQVRVPYVFTDERAVIALTPAPVSVPYAIRTVTVDGWGPTGEGTATVEGASINLAPLCEGLHIVTLATTPPQEARFLAMAPPPAVNRRAALHGLPLAGRKLFAGEPYTLLAMGDSVTNTGDYEGILARLLTRATGNSRITVVDRSYPGRSVDASVRNFVKDALPNHPDVGLIMYGLNDQGAGCALDGYLEQYRWLADRLKGECKADAVFLTPTPDISLSPEATAFTPYLLRTFGFAEGVRTLARELGLPCAEVFDALWGKGGPSLDATGKAMQPIFPLSYAKQFTSQLETGRGDGIHPSVLGHLQIAKAAFRAMMGVPAPVAPLAFTAVTRWEADGPVSRVTVRNAGPTPRSGRLELYPVPDGAVATADALDYALAPGGTQTFTVRWPQITKPDDLLRFPTNQYITPYQPVFAVIDLSGGGSRFYVVTAPFAAAGGFVRERQVVAGGQITVRLRDGRKTTTISVAIPVDSEVGRIPLTHALGKGSGWTAAEVAYVRYGSARRGEVVADGDLAEWAEHHWSPVGEPVQARWTQGVNDNRATPDECYLRWAFTAGEKGIGFAVKATGTVLQDQFTIFLDPRAPTLLGTPGRYYWVSGKLLPDHRVQLNIGETTPKMSLPAGQWRATPEGTALEFSIPYAAMETTSWPAAGDLGLSIWWRHLSPTGGKATSLQWSEDGHPWNTRWYGVVRLDAGTGAPLPYVVHVK